MCVFNNRIYDMDIIKLLFRSTIRKFVMRLKGKQKSDSKSIHESKSLNYSKKKLIEICFEHYLYD